MHPFGLFVIPVCSLFCECRRPHNNADGIDEDAESLQDSDILRTPGVIRTLYDSTAGKQAGC